MAEIDTWAVDLAEVGAVYPFQGSEVIMVVIVMVLWVVWHVAQISSEQRKEREEVARFNSRDDIKDKLE